MINQTDLEIIRRFSEGNASASEKQHMYALFSEKENHNEFRQLISKEFDEYLKSNTATQFQLSYLLDRIHHTIHVAEKSKKKPIIQTLFNWYSVAAAVLLIPVLVAGVYWFTAQKKEETVFTENAASYTIHAPLGSRISFNLPDGTKGWLNSGSSIEYSIPFSHNRLINMTGEAWFDVAYDDSHPFEISAGNSKIKVLGTTFNLNAYPEDKYIEIVLEDGKVEFSTQGIAYPVEMQPTERLIFNGDSVLINKTDPHKYSAWTEGKLIFRGDPMTEVARRIERWYNIEVEIMDKELENFVIRGTFEDDSLENVFKYLSMTSPIRYQIINRQISVSGAYQKEKVLLFKN